MTEKILLNIINARYSKLDSKELDIIKVLLATQTPEDIAKVIENYFKNTNKFDLNEIIKKDVFEYHLTYKEKLLPDYTSNLSECALENLTDCYKEILMKCCSIVNNKYYEPIIEKLYNYFTVDNIPFWCMSGVLYHDTFKSMPVNKIDIVSAMGNKKEFLERCRAQWQRVQAFRKLNPDIFKDSVKSLD